MADTKISALSAATLPLAATLLGVAAQANVTDFSFPLAISSFIFPTRVFTGSGTAIMVAGQDYLLVLNKAVGAASAVTIPAPGTPGLRFQVKDGKGDAATHNITITPVSGLIDGAASLVINLAYGSYTLTDNGTQWNVT